MFGRHSSTRMFITSVRTLTFVLFCTIAATAQSPGTQTTGARAGQDASEQKAARYFETIRQSPSQLWAFLLKMPKGGDLHNHLSGAIYAESYIQWAAENGLCVNNQTMTLVDAPNEIRLRSETQPSSGQRRAHKFRALPAAGRRLVDAQLATLRRERPRSLLQRVW